MMSALCSSSLVDVEVAKAKKELVLRLESVPASVTVKALPALLAPASPSVLSSIRL